MAILNTKLSVGVLVCFFANLAATMSFGQTYQGGIRGLVTDQQGAVIPNARASLVNEATKVERVSVTNSAGQYLFTAVEPGTYTISLSASGFAPITRTSVVVDAEQVLTRLLRRQPFRVSFFVGTLS